MLNQKYKKAFTLVELIVVITILSILWVIAFISFQWYTWDARNSKRVTEVRNVEKKLYLYSIRNSYYPTPDNQLQITWKDILFSYQWFIWDNVARLLNFPSPPLDPELNDQYIYTVNSSRTKYQLLIFMENQ